MKPKKNVKLNLIAALLVYWLSVAGTAWAQEPVPFECTGEAFIVQDIPATLNRVTVNGTATLTQILPTTTIEYNNLGYRSTDRLLYALRIRGGAYGNGVVEVIRIHADGTIEGLGLPPGLPTGVQTRFDAGCISADGNTMYITFGARSDDPMATLGYHLNLYKLDLGSWAGPPNPLPAVTVVPITGDNAWVNDWACGPNGLLYGGDQWGTGSTTNSQLSVLDPISGVRTDYDVPGLGPTDAFGAAWYDSLRGTIFLYENAGTIYEIDVSDLAGTGPIILNTWSAPVSTRNDGTFCTSAPTIDVQKLVSVDGMNYIDADTSPGPQVLAGQDVWFRFVVTNTGLVPLTNITLTDTDFDVSPCSPIPDLDPGESNTCDIGPFAAVEGQHTNIATANAEDEDGNPADPATDQANYFGAQPLITLEKLVSVDGGVTYHEADSAPGPSATVGNDVRFRFVITNSGNVDLYNIALTDTDFDVSGCANAGPLVPGDSYTCDIGPFAGLAGQHENTAAATGEDQLGNPAPQSTDPAHYFGAQLSIGFAKSVSVDGGITYQNADEAPGPTATVGSDLYFKFEVTNTSNVDLYNIALTDTDFDLSGCTIVSPLPPGETSTCVIGPVTALAGQQTNTASVNGQDVDGNPAPETTDPANYFGGLLSITLDKLVSVDGGVTYHEADSAPGPSATVGNDVSFRFVITNSGNVDLYNIALTDTDFDVSGCANAGPLVPGDSYTCDIGPFAALAGQHENTAAATGEDQLGDPAPQSTDPAYYFGAQLSIDLEKSVSVDGGITYQNANEAPGPTATVGSDLYFKLEVTNTSNVDLYNIALTDTDFDLSGCTIASPLAPNATDTCVIGPVTALAGQQINTASANGRDVDGNPAPEATDLAYYLGAAPLIALEKLVSVDGGITYHDADEAPGPTTTVGSDVFFRFVVSNTGNVDLYNISVTDPSFSGEVCANAGPLAPSASFVCQIGPLPASLDLHTNTATANGQDVNENPAPQATDPANYTGVAAGTPSIGLAKSVSVDGGLTYHEADSAPGPTATPGDDVFFKFVVSNTGEVPLINITLTDPDLDLGDCAFASPLAPGASETCVIGPVSALPGQQTNIATVTASHNNQTAWASDPANYLGATPAICVKKYLSLDSAAGPWCDDNQAPGNKVMAGSDIWFRFVVTNSGNVPLTDITLSDTDFDLSGCGMIPDLAPGGSFECVIGPLKTIGQAHTNTATATGNYNARTVQDQDSTSYAGRYWAFCPSFWKKNTKDKGKWEHNAWKYTNYTTDMLLGDVFDSECLSQCGPEYGKNSKTFDQYTLLQALSFKGGKDTCGAMGTLLRAAVASLLNASFHQVMGNLVGADGVYPYTTDDVIALVNEAICSDNRMTMINLKERLDDINEGIPCIDWSWPVPTL